MMSELVARVGKDLELLAEGVDQLVHLPVVAGRGASVACHIYDQDNLAGER